ncbi:MAG: DNA-directed DNA polymerase II small subunit [Candidatus Diapherotrites archaeon]|nr:DNA-directed DNA polymerase II small subunit [Candidatus Diapherotrites archaeon]
MKEELLTAFREKGLFVTPEALEIIMGKEEPMAFAVEVMERVKGPWVRKEDLEEKKEAPKLELNLRKPFRPAAKEMEARVKVFEEQDVTGKSTSEGKVGDFIALFRDRYEALSKMLRVRGNMARDIDTVKKKRLQDNTRVIGMVNSIHTTKNSHRLMEMEDLTGSLKVLFPKSDKTMIDVSQNIIPDEVIAVEGRMSKELFIAKQIYRPDVAMREPNRAEEDIYVALISDMHVGSKLFLEKRFHKFIEWLNGEGKERELAGKVKYITIAGDLVDGVGVYPGQEEELATDDIFKQYEQLHFYLQQVPDYIEMIAIPGNHDAVRIAEPQPALPKEVLGPLGSLDNFRCMGSPGYVSLHGFEVMLYHGASIHGIVPHTNNVNYEHPETVITEWLKRRHLHPVYGEKPPIVPEKRDYLVMRKVPDLLHVGDVHRNGYVTYRGAIGINSGCWQSVTPYQIKLGHHPTPGVLPLVSLRSGKITILKFGEEIK